MRRLPKDFKERWVNKLRSGDYEQGREKLRSNDNKFCCLGVVGDMLVEDGICQWKSGINFVLTGPVSGVAALVFDHPYSNFGLVMNQICDADIPMPKGAKPQPPGLAISVQGMLMHANDSGSSFEQIADWIEEYL